MVIGGFARLWNLGRPHDLIFDETYYVKQGWSMILFGYERDIPDSIEEPDELFTQGITDLYGPDPQLVVHPPVGKWMIGLGQWVFGVENSYAWRIMPAIVGILSILIIGRVAWRMFHSATLATVAASLLALDMHHFVQSRIGLLDIFVMFWALVAFAALLADRDQHRARLARRVDELRERGVAITGTGSQLGHLGVRWWRVAAAVSLGLCIGTKWSGLFFLAVFGLMTVWWDLGARRAAGVPMWFRGGMLRDGIPAFLAVVPLALITYVATWFGWFASDNAYNRNWAAENPSQGFLDGLLPDSLRSLWAYHAQAMDFHVGLQNEHAWEANPWSWMVQGRPTLFYARWPEYGEDGCLADSCVRYIGSLGTMVIWWAAVLGLLVVAFMWLFARDWRAGAALSGIIAGYLPWFLYQDRTIYSFYAVAFVPWVVLTVTYCLSLVLGSTEASERRRRIGLALVIGFVLLALLWFTWFYPVHTAELIPREEWDKRMWFDFWT